MRVLLIEDDKKIANALSKGLKEESYAVDIAANGITGEEFAKTNE